MTTSLSALLELLEADLLRSKELVPACRAIDSAGPHELQQLVRGVRQLIVAHPEHAWRDKITPVLMSLVQWGHHNHPRISASDEAFVREIAGFYRDLAFVGEPRHQLLTFLSTLRNRTALTAMADEFTADPPQRAEVVCLPLVPLFRQRDHEILVVFPQLLEALQHPHAATGILDLANFVTREKIAERHPAKSRFEQLVMLLEGVVHGLEQLEKNPAKNSAEYRDAHAQIQESTPLVVSVCDALGLIGDERAIPHLKHVMELRHRRLQVEAAAALTRLGDEEGIQRLTELAAESPVRLRVLEYADELEIQDRIAAEYQTPVAIAEAEFIASLSDPNRFGFPPTACELVDSRTLYWPGYEEPRTCFLFRFSYQVEQDERVQSFSNVGIAGPLTHVLHADLSHLAPEAVYATFAGWQAEHASIYDVDAANWNLKQEHLAEDYVQRIGAAGYQDIQPLVLGHVFQRTVLVAKARRTGTADTAHDEGTVVADDREIHWYASGNPLRPIGPDEALWRDKGQQLLESFN